MLLLYVLPEDQVNEKTYRFVGEEGLSPRFRLLIDPDSAAIDTLGIRKEDPEPIEMGVPHPLTVVLDRDGVVRLLDVRRDYHVWLDSRVLADALAHLP